MRPIIGVTTSLFPAEGALKFERYGLTALYCRAVAESGGVPLLIPGLGDAEAAAAVFPHLQGLFLTGGVDVHPHRFGQEIHPGCERIDEQRDATELHLIAEARRAGMPILGICRGIQVLNVACGGTLIQDIGLERPGSQDHRASVPEPSSPCHDIDIEPSSLLSRLLGDDQIPVNSLHHQAVDRVAPGFSATATSADGVVEAIEDPSRPFCLAVQCHPELLFRQDVRWLGVFSGFVAAAAAWSAERQLALR